MYPSLALSKSKHDAAARNLLRLIQADPEHVQRTLAAEAIFNLETRCNKLSVEPVD